MTQNDNTNTGFKNWITKPPIAFPLVALFHLFLLGRAVYDFSSQPFPDPVWMQVAWHLAYTAAILGIVSMKRWGAWLYLGLTSANLILRFVLKSPDDLSNLTDAAFPVDIFICFLVLFFYRRFE